jgi:hypothetical protein
VQWSAVVQGLSNRTPQSLQDRQSLTIYNDCDEHADVADRSTKQQFERPVLENFEAGNSYLDWSWCVDNIGIDTFHNSVWVVGGLLK